MQTERFSLPQFEGAFEIRNAEGKPHIIIGGQAVNYWAETFLAVAGESEEVHCARSPQEHFRC